MWWSRIPRWERCRDGAGHGPRDFNGHPLRGVRVRFAGGAARTNDNGSRPSSPAWSGRDAFGRWCQGTRTTASRRSCRSACRRRPSAWRSPARAPASRFMGADGGGPMRRSRAIVRVTAVAAGCLGTAAALVIGAGVASAASPRRRSQPRQSLRLHRPAGRLALPAARSPTTTTRSPIPAPRPGRRIDLKTASTPANSSAYHIDAAPYNLNDGFSPGQTIVVKVPGLDSRRRWQRPAPCRSTTSAATASPSSRSS